MIDQGTESSSSVLVDKHRFVVREAVQSIQRSVLSGAFNTGDVVDQWRAPTAMLAVFVSSTFTDTQLERSFLIDELLFELREEAYQHGIQVVFVDMRWGIRDESSLHHKTWSECSAALDWCKKQSMGMCFLSLQGDKYGYTPLPRSLKQSHLETRLNSPEMTEDMKTKILTWYRIDTNALPEPDYVLRNLTTAENQSLYWKEYLSMVTALDGVPCDADRYCAADLSAGQSVTEWEVRSAVTSISDEQRNDCYCWSHREIDLSDCNDRDYWDGSQKLPALLSFMNTALPQGRTCHYDKLHLLDLKSDDGICKSRRSQYMDQFKLFVRAQLHGSLLNSVETIKQWNADGCGLGLPGSELSEMLHHSDWARGKCETFFGREGLVAELVNLIEHPNDPASREGKVSNAFDGITACVVGVSGAGKTALMAKVASVMYENRNDSSIPVLIRFCGTSAGSRTARDLILSLCRQIEFVFKLQQESSEQQHKKFENLVVYFHNLLSKYPVYLFIDSLDQLSDADLGRSQISFLKGVAPHCDTRIIVSCLPDEKTIDEATQKEKWKYLYLCETRLHEHCVPRVTVQMSDDINASADESIEMLNSLLRKRGRQLTAAQQSLARISIVKENDKTALYINLIKGIVGEWESDVGEDSAHLRGGGIQGLIMQLFESLEIVYGSHLVRLVLGFLVFSQKGVSHVELEDLLSMDAALMNLDDNMDKSQRDKSIFQYHKNVRVLRVPSHIVVRVLNGMDGLVVTGEQGCMQLYHRQLREVAEEWLRSDRVAICRHLAQYFGNLVNDDLISSRKISRQEFTKNKMSPFDEASLVNDRRCKEAARAMLACGMLTEAEAELCSFASVCCRFRCGEAFAMLTDLIELDKLQSSSSLKTQHYIRWLRRDAYTLLRSPIKLLLTSASDEPTISLVYQETAPYITYMKNISPFLQCGRKLGKREEFNSLLNVLGGHSGPVLSVSCSFDGRWIASASFDQTLRISDAETGASVRILEGHKGSVTSVCYSPDGKRLLSGSKDKTLRIWDTETGSCVRVMQGHQGRVASVCYRHDGARAASSCFSGTVRVWDVETGACLHVLEVDADDVFSVRYSPDGARLVSGSSDRMVHIWDAETGASLRILRGHEFGVTSVCFSADSRYVTSGSDDRTIRTWDVETGQCLRVLNGHSERVSSISYSPDGGRFASASYDSTVRVWDASTGACLRVMEGRSSRATSVCYSPDGKHIVSGSDDDTLCIWEENISSCNANASSDAHTGYVFSVCYSPDSLLLASGAGDSTVRVWDALTGACLLLLKGHSEAVTSVSFSADGTRVVSASEDFSVRIWDAQRNFCHHVLQGHSLPVSSVCCFPRSPRVASGSNDRTVRIWDLESGACLSLLEGHSAWVLSVSISSDESRLASASSDNTVRIWDVATGTCLQVMEGHADRVSCVNLSPDGTRVVSSSKDNTVRIWSTETGACLLALPAHNEWVMSVCFSPDGARIVSGSQDKTIKISDAETGATLKVYEGHAGWVMWVCHSPDGNSIASASQDRTVRVWNAY